MQSQTQSPDALTTMPTVFTDIRMAGTIDGLHLAALPQPYLPQMPVFMSAAYVSRADLRMDVKFMPQRIDPDAAARTIEKTIRASKDGVSPP